MFELRANLTESSSLANTTIELIKESSEHLVSFSIGPSLRVVQHIILYSELILFEFVFLLPEMVLASL